jgi:hypothetical protein
MIVATPIERYDVDAAGRLLSSLPRGAYEQEIMQLTDDNVLLKTSVGRYTRGRQYGFTTM